MRLRTRHLTIAIITLAAAITACSSSSSSTSGTTRISHGTAKDVHGPGLTSGVPIRAVALAPYLDEAWIGK